MLVGYILTLASLDPVIDPALVQRFHWRPSAALCPVGTFDPCPVGTFDPTTIELAAPAAPRARREPKQRREVS